MIANKICLDIKTTDIALAVLHVRRVNKFLGSYRQTVWRPLIIFACSYKIDTRPLERAEATYP